MDREQIRCSFLVPFFGNLPPYFDLWAKSCEANYKNFHWFVYNDKIDTKCRINKAVTLIPYTYEEMVSEFKTHLNINISGYFLRRVCDYRIMFYFTRKEKENLDSFHFIGFTDMDMVYGRLMKFMPENMTKFSMISADNKRPCGPFTLINRTQIQSIAEHKDIKAIMEEKTHHSFNEAQELMHIVSKELPPFCHAGQLQPSMSKKFSHRHVYGVWDNGKVIVHDCWRHKKEGGFYHFSRYKDKPRFKIDTPMDGDKWGIHKFGINGTNSWWTRCKMNASLYI
ncbi:MAG: hypothetical protein GY710_07510 [Desulfobacteraceae bacterium]|nr:hypothetical protein [Desulfobacteraceae bacterium]